MAELGYSPSEITYLALSHYHYDHTANANEFAGATWLVRQVERDAMFAEKPPGTTQPSTYSALRESKTLLLKSDEHDVFGDGTVVIKSAPGHTPGHQLLYLKLAKTGAVVHSKRAVLRKGWIEIKAPAFYLIVPSENLVWPSQLWQDSCNNVTRPVFLNASLQNFDLDVADS